MRFPRSFRAQFYKGNSLVSLVFAHFGLERGALVNSEVCEFESQSSSLSSGGYLDEFRSERQRESEFLQMYLR